MTNNIIRLPEVKNITGLSRSSIYALMNDKKTFFPKQVSLGPRAVGWLESEVRDWIDQRAGSRLQDNE